MFSAAFCWSFAITAWRRSAMDRFSPTVQAKLGHYVYRLIDPRNGSTFYVGRGQKSRVFDHASAAQPPSDNEDVDDLKLRTIREIIAAGLEVGHVIHRHGLTEQDAKEIEAALIDAYPGLTNVQSGADSDRGVMHVKEINRLYEAEEAAFDQHKVMLVDIDRSIGEKSIYDAARFAWKASKDRAEQVQYVLAVEKGIIVGAFVAEEWLDATPANFPGFPLTDPRRIGFRGREALPDIQSRYVGKRAPARQRGEANPVRYRSQK
jgi:uncharacterized protein